MGARSSAGTTLGLSATLPASFDETGFDAVTHTTLGEVTDIGGDIGRVYNLITHQPLSSRATEKRKGSYNSGSITVQLALDDDDAGQIIGKTALNSDDPVSVALTLQDGSVRYFKAFVMSFPINVGGVDTITNATIQLEITAEPTGEDIVFKAAA